MMGWAAFFGCDEIVERLIRLGYSPFIKGVEGKNALMMAIEGGQSDIVNMIAAFDYRDKNDFIDLMLLRKTKMNMDNEGNNALHYAYKFNRFEILELLIEKEMGSAEIRNTRG